MKRPSIALNILTLLLLAIVILAIVPDSWKVTETADVYIQAGHEGRIFGNTGSVSEHGREIDWTPIVADEATRLLEEAGLQVIRAKADRKRTSKVKLAISIHFDGSEKACATGASIGYGNPSDRAAARLWKRIYSDVFPYRWMRDNFSKNLSDYYNYRYTVTSDAELLLELGEITCPQQARWLKPRLKKLGHLVAYFAAQRLGARSIKRPVI